jgi:hypothetical protein
MSMHSDKLYQVVCRIIAMFENEQVLLLDSVAVLSWIVRRIVLTSPVERRANIQKELLSLFTDAIMDPPNETEIAAHYSPSNAESN